MNDGEMKSPVVTDSLWYIGVPIRWKWVLQESQSRLSFPAYVTVFDSGHLRSDPVKARQVIDCVLSIMREDNDARMEKAVLVDLHDTVWRRIIKVILSLATINSQILIRHRYPRHVGAQHCSHCFPHTDGTSVKDLQRRFADTMEDYCAGILEHVSDVFENTTPSLEEYIAIRRRGVGATPVFALIEYVFISTRLSGLTIGQMYTSDTSTRRILLS